MKDDAIADPLLAQASRGYQSTLLSQGLRLLCKAVSVVALARLVTPAQHGQFAMAASVFYLVVLFRDFGLGTAAVQARALSEEQHATLWRAHAGLGVLLALVVLLLAPAAARFYQEPAVWGILSTMSVGLLLIGLNAWPRVLLTRELRFAELNQLETLAAVIGTAAMIIAGALGAGGYAFVVFLLVSELVALIEAWRRSRWQPRAAARWRSLDGLWRAGSDLTAYNVLLSVLGQLDTLLMGRWFGAGALGLYSRPNQLLSLPLQHVSWPLTQVMLATIARREPDSPDFAAHVRGTANLSAHLTLPVAAVCAVLPEETVNLLLGATWLAAAPLLRWLAIAAAASYLGATVYGLSVATHRTRRLAVMTALTLVVTAAALWFGRRGGPAGLAAAIACSNLTLLIPRLWWTTRGTPVKLRDYASALAGPIVLSAMFAAGLAAGRILVADAGLISRLGVAAACGLGGTAVCALAWPRARDELRSVWQHLPFSRVGPQVRVAAATVESRHD